MELIKSKRCKKCGRELLETRVFFGSTPSGGFRNDCRICMRGATKKWAIKNPQGVKTRSEKRHTLLKENGGPIPFKMKEFIFLRFKVVCRYCGSYIGDKGEVEHRTPLARGGNNNVENLAWSCYQCNKEKHNKTEIEYLHWRNKNKLPPFEL